MKMNSTQPRKALLGFSLMELSVVLGIISLIAGAGMTMAAGALKTADRIATQEKLTTIKLALDSHMKTYGYLPCPAPRNITPSSAAFGIESRAATSSTGNACTVAAGMSTAANIVYGTVPVRTLGLPDSYAGDSWGNKMTYAVANNMVQEATRSVVKNGYINIKYNTIGYSIPGQRADTVRTYTNGNSAGTAALTISDGSSLPQNTIVHLKGNVYKGSYRVSSNNASPNILGTAGNSLTYDPLDTGGTIEWQSAGAGAAYVVISHGPDGMGAFPINGTAIPAAKACGSTTLDDHNCNDSDAIFYDADYNDGAVAAQHFDDYITWGSNAGLRTSVNNLIYTSSSSSCPAGVCEPWCAGCTLNYPAPTFGSADNTAPPSNITSGAVLCKKVISSNSTDCKASCFWGGYGTSGYIKCP